MTNHKKPNGLLHDAQLEGLKPKSELRSAIEVVADEAIMTLEQALLTIQQRAKGCLIRAREMVFPNAERERQAEAAIRQFCKDAIAAALAYDVSRFNQLQYQFHEDLRRLALPLPIATFFESLAAHHERLNRLGWSSVEVDALKLYAAGGASGQDRIVRYSINDCTLASGRVIARSEIREALRPRWQDVNEYHDTPEYQSMVRAHQDSVAREQARRANEVQRYSSGPAQLIGKPVSA